MRLTSKSVEPLTCSGKTGEAVEPDCLALLLLASSQIISGSKAYFAYWK